MLGLLGLARAFARLCPPPSGSSLDPSSRERLSIKPRGEKSDNGSRTDLIDAPPPMAPGNPSSIKSHTAGVRGRVRGRMRDTGAKTRRESRECRREKIRHQYVRKKPKAFALALFISCSRSYETTRTPQPQQTPILAVRVCDRIILYEAVRPSQT